MAVTTPAAVFPLFARYPGLEERMPRIPLSDGPSPVGRLDGLSGRIGADVWIKNDGLYGTLYGGNKPRKLEFLLPRAMASGARTVITTGPMGTHHGLATALYGGQLGLNVALLLTYQRPSDHVIRQLCRMQRSGAHLHYLASGPRLVMAAPWYAAKYMLRDRGRRPYLLPPGGSTPLGAAGYVNAGLELAEQVRAGELPEPRAVVLAVGSGGTAAGLAVGLGLAGLQPRIIGVAVTRAPTTWALTVKGLALETAAFLRRNGANGLEPRLAEVSVLDRFLGGGYGWPTRWSEEARRLLAAEDGLHLDPTYTAKAMAGLIGACRTGEIRGPVLYWHTYDARLRDDERLGPADLAALPRALRRFCPSASRVGQSPTGHGDDAG